MNDAGMVTNVVPAALWRIHLLTGVALQVLTTQITMEKV